MARLLSEKHNPHTKSEFFGYASVNAARKGQKGILALILAPDRTGHIAPEVKQSFMAAFSSACRAGQQDDSEYLLDLCLRVEWLTAEWLQEHSRDVFEVAASHGHTNILKQLLHNIPTIRARNNALVQSMCVASANGYIDAVRFLLSIGANLNQRDDIGSPLDLASRSGHAHIVRLLLGQGAIYYDVRRVNPLY